MARRLLLACSTNETCSTHEKSRPQAAPEKDDRCRLSAGRRRPQAEGRYRRTHAPAVGSVLVFRRSTRLPDGHVAVVSRVLSDRRILATHANWVHHQVSENVPVIDVSPGNDWTRVRVWWPPANQMGVTEYATFGFVEANSPPEHDQISANARQLINIAISE